MLKKTARARSGICPIANAFHRGFDDPKSDATPVLQHTSRFRTHDDGEERDRQYPTARYPTSSDWRVDD